MIKIALFCAMGMSTSVMVAKMQRAAKSRGINAEISAHAEEDLEALAKDLHVALLGPQVAYRLNQCKKICDANDVSIAVISSTDYGLMNGEKVFDSALDLHRQRQTEQR